MASEVSGLDLHPLSGSSSALWSAQSPVLRIVLTHLQLMTAVSNLRNKDLSEQRSRVREQIAFARFISLCQPPCLPRALGRPPVLRNPRDAAFMPATQARHALMHRESPCRRRHWRTSDLECRTSSCVAKSHVLSNSGSHKRKRKVRTLSVRLLRGKGRQWWRARRTFWRKMQTEQHWSFRR